MAPKKLSAIKDALKAITNSAHSRTTARELGRHCFVICVSSSEGTFQASRVGHDRFASHEPIAGCLLLPPPVPRLEVAAPGDALSTARVSSRAQRVDRDEPIRFRTHISHRR